jgi:hypothetical protein
MTDRESDDVIKSENLKAIVVLLKWKNCELWRPGQGLTRGRKSFETGNEK